MTKSEEKKINRLFLKNCNSIRGYLNRNGISTNGITNIIAVVMFARIRFKEELENQKSRLCIKEWLLIKLSNGDLKGISGWDKKKGIPKIKKIKILKVKTDFAADYKIFLKTTYWRNVRKAILLRDGNKCTECGCKQLLHVHHLTYVHHNNEQDHLEDLITLCKVCHHKLHYPKKHV